MCVFVAKSPWFVSANGGDKRACVCVSISVALFLGRV